MPEPEPIVTDPPEPEPTGPTGDPPEPEPEPTDPPADKTWEQLGLHPRFDGMTRDEIAADILHRNSIHGRQAEEVGQIRKDLATANEQIANFKKAADLPAEVKTEVRKMSEQELTRFLEDFQTDPAPAIRKLIGDGQGKRSDEDLAKIISDQVNEALSGYHGWTEDRAVQSDPDYPVLSNYMETLQQPEHFGNTRGARELLEFARLFQTDKEAANDVYRVMKQYPTVSMKDCVRMVNGTPKAKVDPDKIRKEVKGLKGLAVSSGSKQVSANEAIDDMDDAFDVD